MNNINYSKQLLIDKINHGETPEFLFFWGHQPTKDGKPGSGCLSQWWKSDFKEGDQLYTSAEQYMMAGKARLFNDLEILAEIMQTQAPATVKQLGRKIMDFDEKKWAENCYEIVKQGNLLKFGQNADLKEYLLSTGNKILVEASPYDKIWGIGLPKEHKHAALPVNWKGTNLLGFALMEVRDELFS